MSTEKPERIKCYLDLYLIKRFILAILVYYGSLIFFIKKLNRKF